MLLPPGAPDAATSLLDETLGKVTGGVLPATELFLAAERLKALGQLGLMTELYKTWIAYNAADPLLFAVYFNYSVALRDDGDPLSAINAMRETIRLKPDFYPPYINLGRVLEDSQQLTAAIAVWTEAVNRLSGISGETLAHRNTALQQIGRVLEGVGDLAGAENALKQSLDLDPKQGEVVQHWVSLRQSQCKWPVVEPWDRASRDDLLSGIAPLSLANLADDPIFQLAKACLYSRELVGVPAFARRKPAVRPAAPLSGRKLRIGYVSSDLREHAVGFGMTDVMEMHDREAFEIFAYYCGIPRADPTQLRIRSAVDHWTDITGLDDDAAAQKIADDEIDILVDLNGYTKSACTKVFALRPAPISVNWFGFPGTMGSPYHHYIIADPYIIPADHELYYSETALHLSCYQPNDRRRVVSAHRPSRSDQKLPEDAMVYCCLNGMQKLTAATFAGWMTILSAVPGSVLWLLTGGTDTDARMRQRAREAGIEPGRLIFAEKMHNADHLARYPVADLFLDTFPYGAHTTAADSLWMGVPILTLSGRSFASRVCGSLLTAAGLADMICDTRQAYVTRAIELGRDREMLDAVKRRLAAQRDTCVLFDTPKLVRELEALYRRMWQDLEQGRRPVPNLDNLAAYHDVALDLGGAAMELMSRDAYHAAYRDKLAEAHDFSPLRADPRLWQAVS